ncbi:MAG: hypothetical protein QG577_2835, partial [Thermodesulfobacteriota bacterium]|nr:hypothetical protein [Thermodesulfobacteriota bacterium]
MKTRPSRPMKGSATRRIVDRNFQDEAFRYVTTWCKASREFMERKFDRWKLLEDLYHNRRDLNSWGVRPAGPLTNQFGTIGPSKAGGPDRWQSDIVLAPSYIVDTWADRAYQAIFS